MSKAAICAQGNRAQTYVDAMAAIIEQRPEITEFEIVIMDDINEEEIITSIDNLFQKRADFSAYAKANRAGRKTRVERFTSPRFFKEYALIEVSAVSKHRSLEFLSIGMLLNVPVCSLSWEKIEKEKENIVGVDKYIFSDSTKSPVIDAVQKSQNLAWRVSYILVAIASRIIAVYGAQVFGLHLVSDSFVNFLSAMIGIGGLAISALALVSSPTSMLPFSNKPR